MLNKIINAFLQVDFKYLLTRSVVRSEMKPDLNIHPSVKIYNSRVFVKKGSKLTIGAGCVINNLNLFVNGNLNIGQNNFIDNGNDQRKSNPGVTIWVDHGNVTIGSYNRIRSKILVRFGAELKIGDRNTINDDSEIRADEKITIGDYNQISYRCVIWDTNTHHIYPDAKRRELTDTYYPIFGYEFEKPKTKEVSIGSDCWIGREAAILKGVVIQNSSVVGFRTTLSNCVVQEKTVVVQKIEHSVFQRNEH